MLETSIRQWSQADILELAKLTYDAFQVTKDSRLARIPVDGMEQWLKRLRFDTPPVSVQAHSAEKLVGWLLLFKQDPNRVEINPWALNGHPFVLPGEDAQNIVFKLLKETHGYVRSQGFTRLELNFKRTAGESLPIYERYPGWYVTLGFRLVTETAIMRRPLENLEFKIPQLPSEFLLRPLLDFDDEVLYKFYHEVFSASQNRFFLDQSEEANRAYFDDNFSREDPLNEDTSLVLLKDKQLIGFSLMRPTHGQGNVHLWKFGIHQDYRQRGFGKGLLQIIMGKSSKLGIQTMSLGVEPNNTPAYKLYLTHGFEEEFRQTEYSWKPG